jgi:hypothetical protein
MTGLLVRPPRPADQSLRSEEVAFNHPSEVVNDPDLTLNEKCAILAFEMPSAAIDFAKADVAMSPEHMAGVLEIIGEWWKAFLN